MIRILKIILLILAILWLVVGCSSTNLSAFCSLDPLDSRCWY